MGLIGRQDDEQDLPRGDEEDYDTEAPGVVAMPGLGTMGMGTAGPGVGGLPIGLLSDTEGAQSEENDDHNLTDSPDQFTGGGATSSGRDANADVLDR